MTEKFHKALLRLFVKLISGMRKVYKILLILFIFSSTELSAQQLPFTNQYTINPYLLSPAFAGYNENSQVLLSYRKEWGNIKGSPKTASLNTFFPISEKVWMGGQIISDQTDIFKSFYAHLSYTYIAQLGNDHHLYFGLWGSLFQNTINLSDAIIADPNDPILLANSQLVGTSLNAGTALIYKWREGSIGISIPYLFLNKDAYTVGSGNNLVVINRQIITHLTYNFALNYNWQIQPFFVYRSIKNAPFQYDISMLAIYREDYWAGLMYRNQGRIGINLGGNLSSELTFNYAYEFATKGIIANPAAIHEFSIGLEIGSGKKYNTNRWGKMLKSQNSY